MRRLIWTGTAFAIIAAGGAAYAEPTIISPEAKTIPGPDAFAASSTPPADLTNADSARELAGMSSGGGAEGNPAGSPDTPGKPGSVSMLSAESDSPISEKGTLSPDALGGAIADYALDYLGTPYQYGGSSPAGFDASGFLYYIYRYSAAETILPRTIAEQFKNGAQVGGQSLLLPGDAVFFKSGETVSFCGIYIGNREFVAATVDGVKRSSLSSPYWQERYAGARRLTEKSPGTGSGTGTGANEDGSSGSGSGSSNGNAGPDAAGTLHNTAYFKSIARFLDKAKPVLKSAAYTSLENKAELAFRQYEQGLYAELLANLEEIADTVEALPTSDAQKIGIKSSELFGSSFSVGLYDVSSEGTLKLRKESGYTPTVKQRAAAEQLWKQIRAIYPKSYWTLVKQLRLEVLRGGMSRVETLGKGQARLVLDPSDLTSSSAAKTRWALARELGKLVTQQGAGGAQLDHIGGASSELGGSGGLLGSAFAGPASGSSQWAYFRKDSLMTQYYSKFWTPEVEAAARAGKPMTKLYTKLFFRDASAYQAQEDIADAWAAFLLYDKPIKAADRRDEKMLFFYSKPELVTVRSQARSGMGISKSYPNTMTFADMIGPKSW